MNAPLAEFTNYEELRRALNEVREYRDLALEDLDDLAGLPDRYSAKIFGPNAAKRVGMQSLGDLIGALGVKCILVDDPEAWARISKQERFKTRDAAHLASVRGGVLHVSLKRSFLRKIGAKGGVNRWKNVSAKKRSKLAKKAAEIRNAKLTPKQRNEITRAACKARWAKRKGEEHKERNKAASLSLASEASRALSRMAETNAE